jgi:predicted lipid-binding transport protein (Tim44 family)
MSNTPAITRGFFAKMALAAMLALLLTLIPATSEAKMGAGGFGSRGSRTFSAPPSTRTAPAPAAPMERTVTPPPASSGPTMGGPSMAAPSMGAAPRPGMFGGSFGRGMLGGLAGGLLGAGLFGLLTGHGLFGGMMGFASVIGLLIQFALLFFVIRLAFNWFMSRNAATAGAGPRVNPFAAGPGFGAGAGPGGSRAAGPAGFPGAAPQPEPVCTVPITPTPEDFNAFERLLSETQKAYSREDLFGLRKLATSEMVDYFEEDMARNRGKGVVNRISGVKLLQGDLAEAWREGANEYASVAMRFALIDVFEDRETGKVVSGDPATPIQSTEVWTFRRGAGSGPDAWKLSAIQEAGGGQKVA